ncbi:hypothetical protein A6M21_06235 [Desulfotomaculum copahuensis]|uniref:Uncharacterized protein n=1 Tax=Desulfotomaculum copahuensis TaxID=1838280 RepID=A0A1B7LH49_9FIRM|nr:hypothetical protein A6M21_06235 [Desulfotomaculum copahuensis]
MECESPVFTGLEIYAGIRRTSRCRQFIQTCDAGGFPKLYPGRSWCDAGTAGGLPPAVGVDILVRV